MSDIEVVVGKYIELEDKGSVLKACCPFHGEKTPSFTVFPETESYYCFGCGSSGDIFEFVKEHDKVDFKKAKEVVEELLGKKVEVGDDKKRVVKKTTDFTPMPHEAIKEFQSDKVFQNVNYRGIRQETDKFFRTLSKVDEKGNVIARYYPETREGKLGGYKCRNHPKDFTHGKVGTTGVLSDLSGQHLFQSGGKYVLFCGGEEDKAAAYQMFVDHQRERNQGDFAPMPVVSPTAGEGSAAKQAAAQYDWFDSYDIIVIGMDNDEAGRKAAKEIAEVLPKEKVRIATWTGKDPNKMLEDGKSKQFIRDFYNAKEYANTGIKSSSDIMDDVKDVLTATKISLPSYMHRMEKMMKRAFSQNGRVVNILGSTSCGKSTHVNNMTYHWVFEEAMKPLIISLEMTAGEYAVDLLSLHLKKNLDWFEEGMDAWDYLERDDVKALYEDLFTDEYGRERFRIVDDRDGKLDTLVKQIERGVKQYGCNIVIIDVLTDMLRFLPMDEQEKHMAWQKNFVKTGVSIVNVLHTRKPERDKEGKLRKTTEYDVLGSGTFVQSAHINIIINRDKMAGDEIQKNCSYIDMPKCRRGTTGPAGVWYFDAETRQVYDYDDWLSGKTSADRGRGVYDDSYFEGAEGGEEIDINDIL